MSCGICQATKPVPTCTTELEVGTITDTDTDIYIFVKNLTTNASTHRQEDTTNGSGLVTLDMSLPSAEFYRPGSAYELWVTLRDEGINDRIDITIDSQTLDCLALCFEKVKDNGLVSYSTHNLNLES